MPANRKRHEVRKKVGRTDIRMGIHCEAPTPALFYFCFSPSLTMFLSSFFCIQKNVFFSWNGEDRYGPTCPLALSPLFSKPSQQKWGRTSALVPKQHKAGRSQPSARGYHSLTWNPGLYCKLPAMRYFFNYYWIILALYWQHWNVLILIFGSRGHLWKAP